MFAFGRDNLKNRIPDYADGDKPGKDSPPHKMKQERLEHSDLKGAVCIILTSTGDVTGVLLVS